MRRSVLIAIVVLTAAGVAPNSAVAWTHVASMKLLAPGVGWAQTGRGLLWTKDGGKDWKDITPQITGDETLGSIFFLDRSKGWITINHERAASEEAEFEVVSTSDTGSTWTRAKFTLRQKDYGISADFSLRGSAGRIAFADPLHGWLNVEFVESPNTWWSFLLVTSDGGRTWKRAPHAPNLSDFVILLVSPTEGWLFGMEDDASSRLYVTRDSAHHWREVAPEPPALPDRQVMGLPTFDNAKHGFLQVNGVSGIDRKMSLTMVLLETIDGGRTWKPDRTVGARIDASSNAAAADTLRYKDISQISFATRAQAWAIVGDGDLLSTTDGGATWTDITPGPKR
jgi:photosystem II stability/assembly factor-like uncharacterized protein